MKNKSRAIAEAGLAVLFLSASILGYGGDAAHMWEYCFLSGIAVGLVLLASFVYTAVTGRHFPEWLYAGCTADILIILIATVAVGLNITGAFWFIHVINPVLLLAYWMAFCDGSRLYRPQLVAAALAFPLVYITVSFIRMRIIGLCAFPANMLLQWEPQWLALPVVMAVSMLFLLLAYGLYYVNKWFRSGVEKHRQAHFQA